MEAVQVKGHGFLLTRISEHAFCLIKYLPTSEGAVAPLIYCIVNPVSAVSIKTANWGKNQEVTKSSLLRRSGAAKKENI